MPLHGDFFAVYKIPKISAIPNPIRMEPDTLFNIEIFFMVNRERNLPAPNTFNKSVSIFNARQTEKIKTLSLKLLVTAKAVAFTSQNKITLGFSVLIKKPDTTIAA